MKKCNSCNIHIEGENKYCPLCKSKMNGINSESVFPKNKKYIQLKNYLLLTCIILSLITILIEWLLTKEVKYSLISTCFLVTFALPFSYLIQRKIHFIRFIHSYFFLLSGILMILFLITRITIIATIILPIIFLFVSIINYMILLFKRDYEKKYLKTILFWIISTGVLALLLMVKKVHITIFLTVVFSFSSLLFLTILILNNKQIKTELQKILNII